MIDFFDTANSIQSSPDKLVKLFDSIYGIQNALSQNVFLGLNLYWPKFKLPKNYDRYVISFHTEYLDVRWTMSQAQQIYPRPMLLITDYDIKIQDPWPDNIVAVRYITLAQQLEIASAVFGIQDIKNITMPTYKISSLSYRISQSKKFITAYLLKHFPHAQMILTYHGHLVKDQDHHGYPPEFSIFDSLDLDTLCYTNLNFIDDSKNINTGPVNNTNWHHPAYLDALINLTNESFHYSKTILQDKEFQYPGPYLTEKTLKPLLAGRPFVPVGQAGSCEFLNLLGFSTNFGFDLDYDQDTGDLTRMIKIFEILEQINSTSLSQLHEASLAAVKHNLEHISTGALEATCKSLNESSIELINNFLQG
jgi:hypothetical protein